MTTQDDIKRWFEAAPERTTHMIIVCDTFDYEDYPVYVHEFEDVRILEWKYNGANMQKVMEVYNLKLSFEEQKNGRVFSY